MAEKSNLDQEILDQLQVLKEVAEELRKSKEDFGLAREAYEKSMEQYQKAAEEHQLAKEDLTKAREQGQLAKPVEPKNEKIKRLLEDYKQAREEYQKAKALLEERHQLKAQVGSQVEWVVENMQQYEAMVKEAANKIVNQRLDEFQKKINSLRIVAALLIITVLLLKFFL